MSELLQAPPGMPADFHKLSVRVVTHLDYSHSTVVEAGFVDTGEQVEEVDTWERLVVAWGVLVGILEVEHIGLPQVMSPEQERSILEDIVQRVERSCTRLLLVGVDLEGLGRQKESQAVLRPEFAVYTESSREKSCSSLKFYPSCWKTSSCY